MSAQAITPVCTCRYLGDAHGVVAREPDPRCATHGSTDQEEAAIAEEELFAPEDEAERKAGDLADRIARAIGVEEDLVDISEDTYLSEEAGQTIYVVQLRPEQAERVASLLELLRRIRSEESAS